MSVLQLIKIAYEDFESDLNYFKVPAGTFKFRYRYRTRDIHIPYFKIVLLRSMLNL